MKLNEKLNGLGEVRNEESLSSHTTYRIGGKADYYILPDSMENLIEALNILKEEGLQILILGKGSNVLISDRPFHGAVIDLSRALGRYEFDGNGILTAQAGCSLIHLANEAMTRSLSGLEFASGIPGSVGGGLYMNAGAYLSDLSSILIDVLVYRDGKTEWLPADALEYTYRHSIFQSNKDWVILEARFQLKPGERDRIQELMVNRKQRRMDSQPYDKPCAGSVFRNPEGLNAWKIVDDLGYRGQKRGGACVSSKHPNFIVNEQGEATFDDVSRLIEEIQERAKNEFGIELITEIERIEWDGPH